jgi:hypothetical protein
MFGILDLYELFAVLDFSIEPEDMLYCAVDHIQVFGRYLVLIA